MKLDSLSPPRVLRLVMGWGGKWPGSERCPSCNGKTSLPLSCASAQIATAGPATGMPPAALLVFCGLAALRAVAQHLRHHRAFPKSPKSSVCLLGALPSACRQLLAAHHVSVTLQALGLCRRFECHLLAFQPLYCVQAAPGAVLGLSFSHPVPPFSYELCLLLFSSYPCAHIHP